MAEDNIQVGEFLSERELKFKSESAADFYEHLQTELNALPAYEHSGLGNPAQPNEFKSHSKQVCFFRGQSSANWGLCSLLQRSFKDSFGKGYRYSKVESEFREVEASILETANRNGIVRGLTPLETLSILQHHEVPTRLIDVTTDWKVALYFACEKRDSEPGRVFAISIDQKRWVDFPKANLEPPSLPWWDTAAMEPERWRNSVWPILLPFTDPRMIAQRGYFLVGSVQSDQGGHHYYRYDLSQPKVINNANMRAISSLAIQFPKFQEGSSVKSRFTQLLKISGSSKWHATALSIRIPAEFKPALREILETDGISADSIYPPIDQSARLLKSMAGNHASSSISDK